MLQFMYLVNVSLAKIKQQIIFMKKSRPFLLLLQYIRENQKPPASVDT